jgi:putative DNA primase/helicase
MGHLFAANRLPGTTDHTHGFWRRWLVVEFHRVFRPEEQNTNLRDEIITSELQGIVAWLVEGARRVAARGRYVVPGSSGKAIERWRRQADPVAIFVGEKTRPARSEVERMSSSALFAAYVTWAETNKYRVMSAGKFGQRMRGLGLRSEHTRAGEVYPVRLPALGEPPEEPADEVNEQELAEAAAREVMEADAEEAWRNEP